MESECVAKQKGVLKTEWCSAGGRKERLIGLEDEDEDECLSYGAHFIRSDMGLPSTIDRSTLVDILTKFIYEVTLGHEMAADNIPYMADPSYGGVRISKNITTRGGEILVDFATYIYGNVVAAATTIRSMPLLADWSELLVHWVDKYKEKEWGDEKRKDLKKKIRMIHLQYKADLVHLSNELMKQTLKRPKNEWAPYLNPATQASSVGCCVSTLAADMWRHACVRIYRSRNFPSIIYVFDLLQVHKPFCNSICFYHGLIPHLGFHSIYLPWYCTVVHVESTS